jgi:hypothetical protein
MGRYLGVNSTILGWKLGRNNLLTFVFTDYLWDKYGLNHKEISDNFGLRAINILILIERNLLQEIEDL